MNNIKILFETKNYIMTKDLITNHIWIHDKRNMWKYWHISIFAKIKKLFS